MSDETRTIRQSITINAPAATIFKAFTDAGELIRWFPTEAESNPQPGGKFKYFFDNPTNPEQTHTYEGTYIEILPDQRIAYPWNMAPDKPITTVEINLGQADEGTLVSLDHRGWPIASEANEVFQRHDQGWQFFLENLKKVLEENVDERASLMGMRTTGAA